MMYNDMRNRQTREQMRREKIKTALMAAALIVLWATLTVYAVSVWAEHPGEQQVDGRTYWASVQIGGDPFGNP